MSSPRILIVDDEESVLKVLASSLRNQLEGSEIATANDGFTALECLRETAFDLVVTDYKMAGMDGLELLEAIREMRPETRVILMTAYGNDAVEEEAHRLQAYEFLAKPLQLDAFRQVVHDALDDIAISRPGILILSDERYRQIVKSLQELLGSITARCIFLVTSEGHVVARAGITGELPVEQISSLLGGGIAALLEAGRIVDGDSDSMNMAYREGANECLYAINIGEQLMLLLVTDRGPYSSRIGSVWFYAQRTVEVLRQTLGQVELTNPNHVFDEDFGEVFDSELEQLLDPRILESADGNSKNPARTDGNMESDGIASHLMSFSDAVEAGLMPGEVSDQELPSESGNSMDHSDAGNSAK